MQVGQHPLSFDAAVGRGVRVDFLLYLPAEYGTSGSQWPLVLFLPGAGLVYAGQGLAGYLLSSAFVACFVAAMAIFMFGYASYISLVVSDDLLKGNNLENIGGLFHLPWLIALLILALVLLVASMISLFALRRNERPRAS